MDTPSPEFRRTHLSRLTTPKSVACRKIMNSPAFLVNKTTDISELSMSPLQLLDSPIQAVLMTPSTSSGESPGKKSPRYLKQTSTPSQGMMQDTPNNSNKAFIIASNAFAGIKAKRRLIEEVDVTPKSQTNDKKSNKENSVQANAAKRQKTSPKTSIITIELKKAKAEGIIRNPLDPLNKTLPSSAELCIASDVQFTPIAERIEELQLSVPARPILAQQVLPPKSPALLLTKEKKALVISPKVITRNWNQRYRKETRERKFFKSRGTEEETSNRVVTVSVNDNLKLQIHDKPVTPIRKSPRKSSCKQLIKTTIEVTTERSRINTVNQDWNEKTIKVASEENRINTLSSDWDDDIAESMDISCNIQDILNGLSEEESKEKVAGTPEAPMEEKENDASKKLFPLFSKNTANSSLPASENRVAKQVNPKSQWIRALNDGENQMILDAGQKKYGAIQCPECLMVYHVKDPEDELLHAGIHGIVNDTLKFSGWKKERVVRRFNSEGYIIAIHHGDAAHSWKKVETVLSKVVDKELGFSEIGIRNPEATKVYLYIAEKKIVGVLVAHSLSKGYRMIPSSNKASPGKCCSSDPVPALCGVSRIWTLPTFRRRKTASRLLDAMRSEFIYGKIISIDELAFSDPTETGLVFAQNYTKRQDFLVYNM
uniref:N-acetyltransferase ESCO2 n=1 Tax=Daphnia galeata TaxID=27404 RepID=A0A8J2W461_9CRUS|nr:unnamed protein product [Daphnia galeata]